MEVGAASADAAEEEEVSPEVGAASAATGGAAAAATVAAAADAEAPRSPDADTRCEREHSHSTPCRANMRHPNCISLLAVFFSPRTNTLA
jgi:hypothetical protein